MARALLVGCGCRGRLLGARLLEKGWAVRGTSRREEGLAAIEEAGIEPAQAEPSLPGTLVDLVADVTVVHWLLASAVGDAEEVESIHGSRLERLLEKLVDTPVRGFAYERAGSVATADLERGEGIVRAAASTWRIPIEIVDANPADVEAWTEAMVAATEALIHSS